MSEVLRRRNGVLHIEDVALDVLAAKLGTPLYVYSRAGIEANVARIERALAPIGAGIRFALKANSNRAVLSLLARRGCGAEVVSGGELLRAVDAGFDPATIVFSGVGKQDWEIDRGLKLGIGQFNLESVSELDDILARVDALGGAARVDGRAGVAVRLNPDIAAPTHDKIATGRAGDKFGLAAADVAEVVRRLRGDPRLDFKGLAIHIGSQIADIAPFRAAFEVLAALARDIGGPIPVLDLGGGMAVAYDRPAPVFDWPAFAKAAAPTAALAKSVLIEPGRSICADAGVILSRIIRRKEIGARRFVVIDAAMNDLMRPALYDARHRVEPVDERPRDEKKAETRPYDIVGPICESADTLGRDIPLTDPRPGDLLALLDAGAYAASMASNYNSRPLAAEALVDGRRFQEVRRRQSIEDITRLESPLDTASERNTL